MCSLPSSLPGVSLDLPDAARIAWWGTAWLRGHVSPDDILGALHGVQVRGIAGDLTPRTPLDLLTTVRGTVAGVGIALPAEGELLGLGGPRELNDAALAAGEAVVMADAGLGLAPRAGSWWVLPANQRQLTDVGEADRQLRRRLVETANALAELDVARWRPEVADVLMNLRHRPMVDAPPGTPADCVVLAAKALQAWTIVDLALEDEGGAISAGEAERRRTAILPLGRAARVALVAACSPEVWPS